MLQQSLTACFFLIVVIVILLGCTKEFDCTYRWYILNHFTDSRYKETVLLPPAYLGASVEVVKVQFYFLVLLYYLNIYSVKFVYVIKTFCSMFSVENIGCNIYNSFTGQHKRVLMYYTLSSIAVGRAIFN